MRFALAVTTVLVLQVTSTIAETPQKALPTIQRQLFEIDLRVSLSAYERVATMISETEIDLALMSEERADSERKAMSIRLQQLESIKTKLISHVHKLQHVSAHMLDERPLIRDLISPAVDESGGGDLMYIECSNGRRNRERICFHDIGWNILLRFCVVTSAV